MLKVAMTLALVPCPSQSRGPPEYKLFLLIVFFSPKVPHSDDPTGTFLKRQVSEQRHMSKPAPAGPAQPPKGLDSATRWQLQTPDKAFHCQKGPTFQKVLKE